MQKLLLSILLLIVAFYSVKSNNIEEVINTKCNELNPVISPDGNILYFCKTYCEKENKSDDIFYVIKDKSGNWGQPINIGSPLNNSMNNFVSSVSPDGNTLLLGTVYPTQNDKTIREGVSISYKTESGWSYPVNQIIEDYYNYSGFAGFYLANDGKTLLMTVERDDSKGKKDIYVSFLKKTGIWSKPLNLGSTINSFGDEISPFLASDGETMYFSSDGLGGSGSADIFMSRRLDDTWQNWSNPRNLGSDINTKDWDAYFKIDASGKSAFIVRKNEKNGDMDIHKISLPNEVKPKPVLLVKGKVSCYKSGVPLRADITFNQYEDDKEIAESHSNASNGLYAHTLPGGLVYSFNASSKNYIRTNKKVDLHNLDKYDEIEVPFELVPMSDTLICIRNIFFQTAESGIDAQGMKELEYLAEYLKNDDKAVVEITGHTDNIGSIEKNLLLSEERAIEAKKILVQKGIDPERVIYKGHGSKEPVISNATKWGRDLNRRVEFKVYRNIN